MSDQPGPKLGSIEWGDRLVPLSPAPLPVIYFDAAPTMSHLNGIIGVTLTVTGNVPSSGDKTVDIVAAVVAHLKCNIPAAEGLIGALQGAILLARPVEKPEGKAN